MKRYQQYIMMAEEAMYRANDVSNPYARTYYRARAAAYLSMADAQMNELLRTSKFDGNGEFLQWVMHE